MYPNITTPAEEAAALGTGRTRRLTVVSDPYDT